MAKPHQNKLRLFYLLKLLWDHTDESHAITLVEMISHLDSHGITVERKTLYDDLDALVTFGFDIISRKGKTTEYFLGSRTFSIPELKLLVDAVQASRFITLKKSNELIEKLSNQTSKHEAGQLNRQVHVVGRVKTMNESIYYNVDTLYAAIAEDKKVAFQYSTFDLSKNKQLRRDGEEYAVCPIALTWANENYYLIAYHPRYETVSHFRVDKMEKIRLMHEVCDCPIDIKQFDVSEYSQQVFGMFSGVCRQVTIRFDASLIGVVIDRFGKDVHIENTEDDNFTVKLNIAISPVFLSWLFQFGNKAEILEPREIREQAHLLINEINAQYNKEQKSDEVYLLSISNISMHKK